MSIYLCTAHIHINLLCERSRCHFLLICLFVPSRALLLFCFVIVLLFECDTIHLCKSSPNYSSYWMYWCTDIHVFALLYPSLEAIFHQALRVFVCRIKWVCSHTWSFGAFFHVRQITMIPFGIEELFGQLNFVIRPKGVLMKINF